MDGSFDALHLVLSRSDQVQTVVWADIVVLCKNPTKLWYSRSDICFIETPPLYRPSVDLQGQDRPNSMTLPGAAFYLRVMPTSSR